jgi:hypothetical protein
MYKRPAKNTTRCKRAVLVWRPDQPPAADPSAAMAPTVKVMMRSAVSRTISLPEMSHQRFEHVDPLRLARLVNAERRQHAANLGEAELDAHGRLGLARRLDEPAAVGAFLVHVFHLGDGAVG